ncbi:Hypothetical predicted protein [Lecanosticta acicola]|uniref:Uncharacterized protein n=1 Tax=Lecanosticta acicola TaxID=111012 RepID=A0AAI8Z1T2_9PEZI|nr:Hypothetical predicted protein [Lecanosticta acicola]
MQPTVQLSKADSKVLAQVFDPESSPNRPEVLVDPSLPPDARIQDQDLLSTLKAQEKRAIRVIEEYEKSRGTSSPSKEAAYLSALSILDNLISQRPEYASARNNRAQLRRWRFEDRRLLFSATKSEGLAAVHDLQTSISLASPGRPSEAVSPGQGKLLAQSYTQLAAIYHAGSKDLAEASSNDIEIDGEKWTGQRFEEEASRLFYLGALYGNEVAKALAVHTNPHAKLCGNIVKEAMRKEIEGV